VTSSSTLDKSTPGPARPTRRRRVPGAILGVTSLLLLQSLGLIGLGLWPTIAARPGMDLLPDPTGILVDMGRISQFLRLLVILQGVLALISAIGLLRMVRAAWVMAMAVQSVHLLVALILYFTIKPGYIYPIMAYGVLMVLYLNYSPVADLFPYREPQPEKGPRP
jgi:hypothetical protein